MLVARDSPMTSLHRDKLSLDGEGSPEKPRWHDLKVT